MALCDKAIARFLGLQQSLTQAARAFWGTDSKSRPVDDNLDALHVDRQTMKVAANESSSLQDGHVDGTVSRSCASLNGLTLLSGWF